MRISIKQLPSGYFKITGEGVCNWAQVSCWPCASRELTSGMFPEASNEFRDDARRELDRATQIADMKVTP